MGKYWKTYSWVLIQDHFHLVVKVCDEESIAKIAKNDFKKFDKLFLKKHTVLIDEIRKKGAQKSDPACAADLTGFQNLLNLAELVGVFLF